MNHGFKKSTNLVLSLLVLCGSAQAETSVKCGKIGQPCVSLSADFATILHLRNDSDFDSTQRYYDVDGQSQGQVATFFSPTLTLKNTENVQLVYRIELGWNGWSRWIPWPTA